MKAGCVVRRVSDGSGMGCKEGVRWKRVGSKEGVRWKRDGL